MMRGDDDIENNGQGVYIPSDSGGARQRRAPSGNGNGQQYSSIPTQQAQHVGYGPNSYDADSLKKKSTSYSTPTFNTLSQRSFAVETPTPSSFFSSTAHLTEGPNRPFYRDNFNDQPFSCDFGTGEENGTWG